MSILDGFKTCRKGLHQYSSDLKQCPECKKKADRESNRRWREKNSDWQMERVRRWREENPARYKENKRRWQEENLEHVKEYNRRWREENPERQNEIWRRWRKKHPEKVNAVKAKRRAAEKQAIASWADINAIEQIYAKASELTELTGITHEVDHIYPLQSNYMCGLHVETNLQILTKSENSSKGNRTWPGQLDCQKD